MLTKQEILNTNNWYEADYLNSMEGYFWNLKSILHDNYTFYMRRDINDGYTIIKEEGKNEEVLFAGYIETLTDLLEITRLLKLIEI